MPKGWFPVSRNFYVRTCVKFTFANEIEAVYERSLVSVKVEPRSTTLSLKLSTFYLASILFTWLKFTCVTVRYRALPCVSKNASVPGNQPLEGETELLDWAVMRDTALIYETRHGLNDNMDTINAMATKNVLSFGSNIGFDTDLERSSIHFYYYYYHHHLFSL